MGWSISIGGKQISGDYPGESAAKAVEQTAKAAVTLAEALKSGDIDKAKEIAGEMVLANAGYTVAGKELNDKVISKLNKDDLERAIGTGLFTFATTGDIVLTIISMAKEYYAEHSMRSEPTPLPPFMKSKNQREAKHYSVKATTLIRYTKHPELVETDKPKAIQYWAGFREAPKFIETASGTEYTWPHVDIMEGDVVQIEAETNFNPKSGEGEAFYSIASCSAIYLFDSNSTPGVSDSQITYTLVFGYREEIEQ